MRQTISIACILGNYCISKHRQSLTWQCVTCAARVGKKVIATEVRYTSKEFLITSVQSIDTIDFKKIYLPTASSLIRKRGMRIATYINAIFMDLVSHKYYPAILLFIP